MSNYIATAFVKIQPDLKGFRAALRTEVNDAVTKVGAKTVLIKPSTTGFATNLRGQLKKQLATFGTQKVPVTPELTAFRARIAAELRENPISIPVRANMAPFRAQIEKEIALVNRTLKVKIPVEAVRTAAAGAAGAAASGVEAQRLEILRSLRESENALTAARVAGISPLQKKALLTKAATAAESAGKKAIDLGLESESKRTAALTKRAFAQQASVQELKAESAAAASAAKNSIGLSKTQAALDKDLTAANSALTSALQRQTVTVTGQNDAIKASSNLKLVQQRTEEALAAAVLAENQAEITRLTTLKQSVAVQAAAAKAAVPVLGRSAQQAALVDSFAKANDSLSRVLQRQTIIVSTENSVLRVRRVLQLALGRTEKALELAVQAENAAEIARLTTLKSSLGVQLTATKSASEGVAAFNASATAASKLGTRFEFLRRGGLATGLSLLGVRGATLAANASFLVGAASVAAFAKAVQSAANLEQNLNVFAVTAGATNEQLRQAGETARQLGADLTLPTVSAGDAAQAMNELAKAGLSVEDTFAGTRGVLQLATAAQIDNAEATILVASALNSFGLAGEEAVRVADLLTGAANESQGSISEMGVALQQSSAVARQAGISLQDTVALLTLLARNGLKGSDAGTSLRTALLRLIKPTQNANAALEELDVRLRDAEGSIRPESFAELSVALEGVSKKQRDATLALIFGQDAFRAAAILGREGAEGLDLMRTATQKVGLANELAGARTKGFSGSVEGLKNSIATLGVSIGAAFLPPLGLVLDTLNEAVSRVNLVISTVERLARFVPELEIPPIEIEVGPVKVDKDEGTKVGKIAGTAFRIGFRSVAFARGLVLDPKGTIARTVLNQVRGDSKEAANSLSEVTAEVEKLFETFRRSQSVVRAEVLVIGLNEMIARLKLGDEEARQLARNLEEVRDFVADAGRLPPIDIKTALDTEPILVEINRMRKEAIKIGDGVTEGFVNATGGIAVAWEDLLAGLVASSGAAGTAAGTTMATTMAEALANSQKILGAAVPLAADFPESKPAKALTDEALTARLLPFEFRVSQAQRGGNRQEIIRALQAQKAEINEILDEENVLLKDRIALNNAITSIDGQIESIQSEAQSEAQRHRDKLKDAADKVKDAREDAHQALIDSFNLQISKQQNVIAAKQATKQLSDDLKAARVLKKILKGIINSGKLRRDELVEFRSQFIAVNAQIAAIVADMQSRAREQAQRVRESIELDVELASIRGNVGGEIRARQRLIRQLKRLQKDTKEGSVEWKRLRNEIAAEQKAIKELKGQVDDRSDAFAELSFAFLQAQQGFAANLFGNLLPIGGSSGLVGISSPVTSGASIEETIGGGLTKERHRPGRDTPSPGGAITRAAARAGRATATAGFQGKTEIDVLRLILEVLNRIERKSGHPEARRTKISQGASMETM